MKFKIILFLPLIAGFIQNAKAACGDMTPRTFNGDEAVSLTYILKNSSIATKTTVGNVVTWSLPNLVCRQANRGVYPDLMPVYDCSIPSGIGPITAKSLFDTMSEMGVLAEGTTGHLNEQITHIKCRLNKNGAGGEAINPRCVFTAAWGDQCP